MSSKQRKITSLCIRLTNLIQTQKFRSSYVNFIFKVISLSSYISSSDVKNHFNCNFKLIMVFYRKLL